MRVAPYLVAMAMAPALATMAPQQERLDALLDALPRGESETFRELGEYVAERGDPLIIDGEVVGAEIGGCIGDERYFFAYADENGDGEYTRGSYAITEEGLTRVPDEPVVIGTRHGVAQLLPDEFDASPMARRVLKTYAEDLRYVLGRAPLEDVVKR